MAKLFQRLTNFGLLAVSSTVALGLAQAALPVTTPDWLLSSQVLAAEVALSASDIYDQSVESVVTIYTLDENYTLADHFGSGFLVRSDGLIMTNAHVVREGTTSAVVMFSDGSKGMAEVIGYDRQGRDLAALQLVGDYDLPALTLATQGMPKIGESVYAIGAPRGISNTLTSGIVGNVASNQTEILHNAAINGGNSGGPLLDAQGDVIGINTWIYGATVASADGEIVGHTDGYSGMSFAIATNQILDFMADVASGTALSHSQATQRVAQN